MSIAMLDEEKLQKLFYFSLKKTGNPHEAEELVQETALEMIKMLNKKYTPDNFNAWMWTVAKKRYARWCKSKKIKLSRYETDDILDYVEISEISNGESVEDDILYNEDTELLRRELALMTKDYRDIVVSYYFSNKKIEAISQITGLPVGTVKRKLYEARKNIKEGMKMARTKGQRSFAPEDISFGYNVNKTSESFPLGKPWYLLKSLAAKNIALEAYNNPSTVEELSLALGIAVPYIEDELKNLLETEVMIKNGDGRMETNFIIFDANAQKRLTEISEEAGKQICPSVFGIIEENTEKIREIGFINNNMPKEYLYWCLLYITIEKLTSKLSAEKNIGNFCTKRPNGDEWDITGNENWDALVGYSSLVNRTNDGNYHFDHFKIDVADLFKIDGDYCISGNEICLLADIIKNNRTKFTLDESENKIVDSLVNNHVVTISGDAIKTGFPIFNESEKKEFTAYHNIVSEIYEGEIYNRIKCVYDSAYEIISETIPARFKGKPIHFSAAIDWMYCFRCILLRYAHNNGIVKIPEGEDKSAVTMYMKI